MRSCSSSVLFPREAVLVMLWPGIVDAGQLVVPRPNEQYGQAIYMSEQQPFQGEENFVTPAQQAWTTPPFRPVQQGMGGWPVGGLPAAGEPTAHPAMTPPKRKLPEDPDLLSPLRTKRLRTTEPWRPEDPVCNELSSFPASPARAHKRKADPLTPGDGLVGKRTRGLDFLPQDYVQRDARKKRHYSDMEAPDEVYQGLARLQLAPCRQVPTTHVLINKRQRRAHGDDPSSSEDEDDGVERFVVIDRQRLNDPLSDVIRDMYIFSLCSLY